MKSVRRSSLRRFAVLAALVACLSGGLASAQSFKGRSKLALATRGGPATLAAWNYSSMSNAVGSSLKYQPPDPCSPWEWAKGLLRNVGLLL